MLLLKLLQQLFKALNSEGTPGQVAAGVAMGAAFALTPLMNLHNLALLLLVMVLNVSLAGVFLGWTLLTPTGFALDPLFDRIGHALLGAEALRPLWTWVTNTPVLGLANLTNTVVLGSLVFWVVAWLPLFFLARYLVATYRRTIYERLSRWKLFQAVKASRLYNVYRLFQPQ